MGISNMVIYWKFSDCCCFHSEHSGWLKGYMTTLLPKNTSVNYQIRSLDYNSSGTLFVLQRTSSKMLITEPLTGLECRVDPLNQAKIHFPSHAGDSWCVNKCTSFTDDTLPHIYCTITDYLSFWTCSEMYGTIYILCFLHFL